MPSLSSQIQFSTTVGRHKQDQGCLWHNPTASSSQRCIHMYIRHFLHVHHQERLVDAMDEQRGLSESIESRSKFGRRQQSVASSIWLWSAAAVTLSIVVLTSSGIDGYFGHVWDQRRHAVSAFRDLVKDSTNSTSTTRPVSPLPADRHRVGVWSPHSRACRGDFTFQTTPVSVKPVHAPPTLMLREASVDFRHNSVRDFRIKHHLGEVPFRRVTLQVSAIRGLQAVQPVSAMEREDFDRAIPSAFLTTHAGKRQAEGWRSEVDYIQGDPNCVNKCFFADFEKQICAGQEWQVIVTIVGPSEIATDSQLENALNRLESASASASLDVNLPVRMSSEGDVVTAKLTVGLGCISGLLSLPGSTSLQDLLPRMPPLETVCANSVGSVVAVGGAMFGYKRNSPEGRKEAANFAARSLLGSARFDTVAISVIANYSVSEIYARCGHDDSDCVSAYHQSNDDFMTELAGDVEKELRVLAVPPNLWSRIVLFPMCRLGTDFDGFEANGHGCRWSAFSGQWVTNEHSYTLLSPYHKWFASFDLDEFVVNEAAYLASTDKPDRRVAPQSASALFDRREPESVTRGVLRLPWMEFKMLRDQTTNLSKAVLKTGGLEMISTAGRDGPLDRSSCLQSPEKGGGGGKGVLSCSNGGIGIYVHDTMSLTKADDMRSRQCNGRLRFDTKLALYHAHGPRFGDCTYPRGY